MCSYILIWLWVMLNLVSSGRWQSSFGREESLLLLKFKLLSFRRFWTDAGMWVRTLLEASRVCRACNSPMLSGKEVMGLLLMVSVVSVLVKAANVNSLLFKEINLVFLMDNFFSISLLCKVLSTSSGNSVQGFFEMLTFFLFNLDIFAERPKQ